MLSPLLSAQFAGWLAPGIAMAWAEGDRRHAAMAAAAVALTVVFWSSYGAVLDGERVMLAVVVARNVCLAAVATSAIALLAGPGSPALSPEAK